MDSAKLLIKEKSSSGSAINRKLDPGTGNGSWNSCSGVGAEDEEAFWGSDLEEELAAARKRIRELEKALANREDELDLLKKAERFFQRTK